MSQKDIGSARLKDYMLLHMLFFVYSAGGICAKLAAAYDFFSIKFMLLYGAVLLNLFIYAIAWQQLLKKMPLTTAYMNKAITIVWGFVWGMLVFDEAITIGKIIGGAVIIIGVLLVVSDDK
ncbi:MAG: transporter [Lachnospiraceae bacterium]|nr:transporter [Lachnospiraceae bacterium]